MPEPEPLYGPGPSRPHNHQGNGNGDLGQIRERLAKIETEISHLARREDLGTLKNGLLTWLIGILIVTILASVGATAAILRAVWPVAGG